MFWTSLSEKMTTKHFLGKKILDILLINRGFKFFQGLPDWWIFLFCSQRRSRKSRQKIKGSPWKILFYLENFKNILKESGIFEWLGSIVNFSTDFLLLQFFLLQTLFVLDQFVRKLKTKHFLGKNCGYSINVTI